MNPFQQSLAEVEAAIERCEATAAACELAVEKLRQVPAGVPFAAAWAEYEKCSAAFRFANAQAEVALEDAFVSQP